MTRGLDRRNSAVAPPTIGALTIYLSQDAVDSARHQWAFDHDRGDAEIRSVQSQPVLLRQQAAQPDQGAVLAAQRVLPLAEAARGREFKWPARLSPLEKEAGRPPVVTLTDEQFLWLLEGLDLKHLKPHRALEYRSVL